MNASVRDKVPPLADGVQTSPEAAKSNQLTGPGRIDRPAITGLFFGHMAADFVQGAVPALIVFFQPLFGLSYFEAAAIVLAATFSSSLAQPLFGLWSDRHEALWLLPVGLVLGGVGLSLAVVAPTYPLLLAAVFLSATGVGGFHPEGAKYAGYAGAGQLGRSVSVFSLGGNIGLALGPIAASILVLGFGLHAAVFLGVPPLIIAFILHRQRHHFATLRPTPRSAGSAHPPTQTGALVLLLSVVALRSLAFYGLFTFVPLWEIGLGASAGYATLLLSLILTAGAFGTIVCGYFADRIGGQRVLLLALAATGPLIAAYVFLGGVAGAAAVILAGAMTVGTFTITTSLSQQYMPGRVAMASGLSMGFSIGLGGVAAIALGSVADAFSLRSALLVVAVGAVMAALLAVALPAARSSRGRRQSDVSLLLPDVS